MAFPQSTPLGSSAFAVDVSVAAPSATIAVIANFSIILFKEIAPIVVRIERLAGTTLDVSMECPTKPASHMPQIDGAHLDGSCAKFDVPTLATRRVSGPHG